ncbi:hypothetical protein PHLCEN_2v9565 [Hermanssonia centrifuga]|uniref:Uncharacterized protein n=1 Tax=Hermanssonia centrifuga TaxID=98765 RepID=A0A2R6NR58_9APHY|nr:hypothetical protein PHLCEN_2v9565 [Hermanssonia centrifuga]
MVAGAAVTRVRTHEAFGEFPELLYDSMAPCGALESPPLHEQLEYLSPPPITNMLCGD